MVERTRGLMAKVEVVTFCWNEMQILPWAVDYWRRYADHVTVYDNGSDDDSVEFLLQHGDFISVEQNDTGGKIDDVRLQHLKNNAWKQFRGKADFVVVCDMDEMLIARRKAFDRMKEAGGTIASPIWYNLISDHRPPYEPGRLLHTQRSHGVWDRKSKAIIFDPNMIDEVNYLPGAHQCKPTGEVHWYCGADMTVLHVNHGLSLGMRLADYKRNAARQSAVNLQKGYGIHYNFSEERIRQEWEAARAQVVDFAPVIEAQ